MSLVRVHAPDEHVVLQDHLGRDVGDGVTGLPASTHSRQTEDAAGPDLLDRVRDHRADTRALDDHVRLEPEVLDASGVVGRAQRAHELRLQPRLHTIEDVDIHPVQPRSAGRQESDRAGAGHEHRLRFPEGALPHEHDLLQRLRDDGHRLEQHAEEAERRVHLDRVLGLDAPALRHEPVDLLDPALGVLAVPAHVPFAHGAGRAGHRVRAANDADHEVALLEPAARARVEHSAEGLVPEHEARVPRRSPAVLAFRDLDVRPADADGHGLDEDRALTDVGLGNLLEAGASRACRARR